MSNANYYVVQIDNFSTFFLWVEKEKEKNWFLNKTNEIRRMIELATSKRLFCNSAQIDNAAVWISTNRDPALI